MAAEAEGAELAEVEVAVVVVPDSRLPDLMVKGPDTTPTHPVVAVTTITSGAPTVGFV